MNLNDLKGLKYYLIYALALLAFFTYSGMVGWKWFNPTKTERERGERANGTHGRSYIYHK
jgi:hypothetical protein